jgi:hypothetical protein
MIVSFLRVTHSSLNRSLVSVPPTSPSCRPRWVYDRQMQHFYAHLRSSSLYQYPSYHYTTQDICTTSYSLSASSSQGLEWKSVRAFVESSSNATMSEFLRNDDQTQLYLCLERAALIIIRDKRAWIGAKSGLLVASGNRGLCQGMMRTDIQVAPWYGPVSPN